jgi:hypothetical protein
MDTFEIGRRDAYALASKPTCESGGSVALSPAYQRQAEKDAATQLLKAAVRLAAILNAALTTPQPPLRVNAATVAPFRRR